MIEPTARPSARTQWMKLMILGSLFAFWLAADLWTKDWADKQLADPRHPIAVTIEPSEDGRTIGEVITERLSLEPGPDADRALAHLLKLPAHAPYTASTPMYGGDAIAQNTHGFYVFWREDPTLAPRRLDRTDRLLANRWLSAARRDADPGKVLAAVDEHLVDLTMEEWLSERLRRLSDDRVEEVTSERMHPILRRSITVSPDTPAVSGDTYLVELRQVDVMGAWFKYVYAENTGAAFGFLKGAPAMLRDTIFFSLTIVVLFVIVGIIIRTDAQHRMVLLALTGILSGAIGNFIDRIRYGYVIDFIDMDLGFYHWPTYNVADIGISCGVVLLMLDITFNKESPLVAEIPEQSDAEPAPCDDATEMS